MRTRDRKATPAPEIETRNGGAEFVSTITGTKNGLPIRVLLSAVNASAIGCIAGKREFAPF
jgi:hypothetical protein